MSDSDGEDGASYNDPTVHRFDEPVNVKDGEALLVDVKDGKVLARAVPSFQLGGPNPSPCSFEGCGKPATVYDRNRPPFIWCDEHDPTGVEADEREDMLAAFHEEPTGPEPAWAPAFRRAGGRFHGARYQFVSVPPDNDDLRAAIRSGIVFPAVAAETEDGDDDAAGWVYRVRPGCPDGGACHHACDTGSCFRVLHCSPLSGVYPDDRWPSCFKERPVATVPASDVIDALDPATRVDTALSEEAAKAAAITAAEIAAGIETVAGFKAKLRAAKAARRAKSREDDGITRSGHPGRFTFSDTIEADGDLVLDVEVTCYIEASPYGATFEEPAGCDLEATDFEATLDGVKLSPGVVEDMAKAGDWPTRAVETFEGACDDYVQPGIYQDTRAGGSRWQVLGHLREPGEAVGGWVVCRPVSAYGLPLSEHGTPRGGWRLAESTLWDDETMAPEVPKAGPGVLRMAGAVDAPDPLTQAGPWATMNRLMALASSKRRIMDGDEEEADQTEALREARDLAYEQAARENAQQDVEAGRPVLMSYQVRKLIEACADDTGLRAAIAALGPSMGPDTSTEAGYLVRLTDAETAEIHRLLDAVETRADQPRGGIRWVETIRGKLSRRRP